MNFKKIQSEVYENLPPLIKNLTDPFEGREKDVVLLSTLGVISSVLPNVHGIYDGNKVSANFYLMVLAPPASGKGVLSFSKNLIIKINKEILKESFKKQKEWGKEKNRNGGGADYPPFKVKIIPGNISSADLYDKIKNAHHGAIIIESETDTLNAIMKQDFGDFSDVLRKAFHHEDLSISRKVEKQFDIIEKPRLSLVLSGTPDQLGPFIKSTKNGLFSRIAYYFFNEITEFKDVFAEREINIKDLFLKTGDEIHSMYYKLLNNEFSLQFKFTIEQELNFVSEMRIIYDKITHTKEIDFIASVKRHGLIMFRIAMILNVTRQQPDLNTNEKLICTEIDFKNSLEIIRTLIGHAYSVFTLDKKFLLPSIEQDVLNDLSLVFTSEEAVNAGLSKNISERTIYDKLNKWRRQKLIIKMTHGKYRKANN
ncbi:DUF3987 domain-containing protein [Gillisia sp. JM1]|uniref:DUF3987 domain-containing protein n=1 Tax=Gillisia sp. JM1 TaxID=1283286 RepID=UPI000422AFD8|nr:DUF3987 domain-containing protein [Gillisia sp. JM1]